MRTVLVVTMLLAFAGPAAADTLLRLSETARIQVRPDEIVAELRAEAAAATPAEAQSRVNAAIGKAIDAAKAVQGIVPATGFYNVFQSGPPAPQWHASQTVTLRGTDGAAMLKLVGSLQGQGLGLQRLDWEVAPATARHARSEATRQALGALRSRAEEAAAILGLRFASFREIRLDGAQPGPGPMPRAMPMKAMAASAPPRAEADMADIEATVEADAVLVPAQP